MSSLGGKYLLRSYEGKQGDTRAPNGHGICQYSGCGEIDEDLFACDTCGMLVCEESSYECPKCHRLACLLHCGACAMRACLRRVCNQCESNQTCWRCHAKYCSKHYNVPIGPIGKDHCFKCQSTISKVGDGSQGRAEDPRAAKRSRT